MGFLAVLEGDDAMRNPAIQHEINILNGRQVHVLDRIATVASEFKSLHFPTPLGCTMITPELLLNYISNEMRALRRSAVGDNTPFPRALTATSDFPRNESHYTQN